MTRAWTGRGRGASRDRSSRGSPGDGFETEALGHLDSLYGTALRLPRDRSDAEDLVQDTYLKAFRFARSFEQGTNLKAWLFTILHNTFRNRLRQGSRDPVDVDSEVVDQAAADGGKGSAPEDVLLRATDDQDLQTALYALPAPLCEQGRTTARPRRSASSRRPQAGHASTWPSTAARAVSSASSST